MVPQSEVSQLKKQLAEKESQLSIIPFERGVERELSWLDGLSHQISENVQERINLQKALFELEETNLRNRTELQHLDDAIAKQVAFKKLLLIQRSLYCITVTSYLFYRQQRRILSRL